MTEVVLYSKRVCHLCDLASEILADLAHGTQITWRRVDIETDPALFDRFQYEVPVIEIVGGAVLKWPTTRERVRRAIVDCSTNP